MKGQLANINDVKDNRNTDDLLSSVRDIREIVCSSMGFPHEIVFGGDAGVNKPEFLKRYSRYLRKIKDVQFCIANGMTQIALAHLANKGISNVKQTDIQVNFRNSLVNLDELEKLEFVDGMVQMITNINTFAEQLEAGVFSGMVDKSQYQHFLYEAFSLIGHDKNFIKMPEGYVDKGVDSIIDS